jgi:hypothetical protein
LITLHTFGDSHAGFPKCNWCAVFVEGVNIITHWIGPVTCAYFGISQLETLNISKFGVVDGDVVCFSFGEIDVRANLAKENNRYEFMGGMINRYFEAIEANVSQFKNLTVLVFCIPPVAKLEDTKRYNDMTWPTLGTDDERKKYTEYLNEGFKQQCINYNYTYFDFYKECCADDGYLDTSLSDGTWHIKDPKHIKAKLIEIINK